MSTIRELLEGRDLQFASPLATHVSKHVQDPVGATKDSFGKLQKAKLNYDMAREETQRNLAPVQSVITHLSQMHGLQPDMPTPAMGVGGDPNMQDPNAVDEDGNPIDPAAQQTDEMGNHIPPGQAAQPGGNLNVNRPSQMGHQPGVAPMMPGQVVPPKLGMAAPGGKMARNSPQPKGSNPQDVKFNPTAKPPKGSKQLPGAKGPGDPKVANRTKKAQNNAPGKSNSTTGGRAIKIQVHASRDYSVVGNIEAERSFSDLKFHASIKATGSAPIGPGGALGPSGVMPGNNPATGARIKSKAKKMKALDELSDKEPGNVQHQVAFNPKFEATGKTIDMCAKCGKMHAEGDCSKMKASGHSRGAKKGWSTRGKGHLSKNEKMAHYSTLDAREFSTKQRKKLAKTGVAMPHGGFPIANRQDLNNAKRAIGRAKNRAATIRHINDRAKALGAPGFDKHVEAGGPGSGRKPGFGSGAKSRPSWGYSDQQEEDKKGSSKSYPMTKMQDFPPLKFGGVGSGRKPEGGNTRPSFQDLSESMSGKELLDYVGKNMGKGPSGDAAEKDYWDRHEMAAVAPPGREDQVRSLKKKFGKKAAFKIAWHSYKHPAAKHA